MSALTQLIEIMKRDNYVVLDTETTGIGYGSEIVEIAIIDPLGGVLVNTRVKPVNGIPEDAARIHGIRGRDVSDSPIWPDVRGSVRAAMEGRDVIIYNQEYDVKMLRSSDGVHKIKDHWDCCHGYTCAMLAYPEYAGEWNDYRASYRWHKLSTALYRENLRVGDAHSALGDTVMTLALIKHLSTQQK